ncbi:Bactericidal/permeability-increasing protein-like 1 [Tupaia chinensis]|uniref:Bactericidal/permeability-increasing protein-like 1 n=1 Tax=Tupaia chinensis TaxID=246437 RepID=L9L3C8_TUPCH|nr:Bactericidal/permeability-increasing protein-like 1 [Tupaia chinensis]
MAQVCGLGLLLVLLLSVAGASMPGTVVRINMAALNYVSEIGRAPLQRALQVTIPYFLDQSGETLQPTRIQIRNVVVPHLHLNFVADLGIHMSATANFTFQIFRASEPLELMLPVVLLADARVAQGSIGTPVVSISACFSRFGHASVFDGSNSTAAPALLVPVQKHIKAVLRNKCSEEVLEDASKEICLSISNLVQGLNVHLGTLIGLNPVGPESQIRYYMTDAPTVTSDCISLDINAILFLLGKPIVLPKDATRFTLPPDMGTTDTMVTVGISQHMFDSTFLLLQKAGTLNLDVTGHLVARQFPEPRPLVLKVRLGATPVATLRTNNAMLRLQPFVEVLVPASNSAFQSLFSLDVVVNLTLQLSVSKVRLQATTSVLGDVQLTVASSNVGFIDIDQVHKLVGTVFEKPLLDHLNALLGIGLALPNVVNLFYANPEVFVHEGYVVISSGLSYQR